MQSKSLEFKWWDIGSETFNKQSICFSLLQNLERKTFLWILMIHLEMQKFKSSMRDYSSLVYKYHIYTSLLVTSTRKTSILINLHILIYKKQLIIILSGFLHNFLRWLSIISFIHLKIAEIVWLRFKFLKDSNEKTLFRHSRT